MKHVVKVTYERKTIIDGAKVWWKLKYKNDMIISPLLLAIIILGIQDSEINSILIGIAITVGLMYFLMVYGLGFYMPRKSANIWKKAGLKSCIWEFNKYSFSTSSEVGDIETTWNNVKELILTEKYWFLTYQSGAHSSLPIEEVSEDIRDFIKEQATKNGAKIIK